VERQTGHISKRTCQRLRRQAWRSFFRAAIVPASVVNEPLPLLLQASLASSSLFVALAAVPRDTP
jgi:hypothetical protein